MLLSLSAFVGSGTTLGLAGFNEPGWEKLTWRDRSRTAMAKFAVDSLLEGEGFELSVPGHWTSIYRRKLVWEIERKLAEDGGRPGIYYARTGYCSYPYVKNLTIMVNSNYNGWRFEDVWLDR